MARKTDIIHRLNEVFYRNFNDGKKSIILIDEAQLIEDELTFEEVRLLLNFQLNDRFLLTLVLVGQPELGERVRNIPQLDQRIAIQCYLGPMTLEDTREYIMHRLKVAGAKHPLFTDGAIRQVFEYTEGVPRRINNLCDTCLLVGFSRNLSEVGEEVVKGLVLAEGGGRSQ